MYGTNHALSDDDYRGVFQNPNSVPLSIYEEKSFIGLKEPDVMLYELRTYMRYASRCNPNIIELLYAPKENILHSTRRGRLLIKNRRRFLSTYWVRKSYGGFAVGQRRQLEAKWDRIPEQRRQKYALHYIRVLMQGIELLERGRTNPKVQEVELLKELAASPLREINIAGDILLRQLNETKSCLPDVVDLSLVNDLLLHLRGIRPRV
jgi:predicted nucleotidyltransferase